MNIHARVRGPHAGIRLTNGADGVFHCPSPERSTAGCNGAGAQALGKDLQDGNGIIREDVGVDLEVGTELQPQLPGPGSGMDSLSRYSGGGRCLNSAPINPELVDGVSVSMRQGDACG